MKSYKTKGYASEFFIYENHFKDIKEALLCFGKAFKEIYPDNENILRGLLFLELSSICHDEKINILKRLESKLNNNEYQLLMIKEE